MRYLLLPFTSTTRVKITSFDSFRNDKTGHVYNDCQEEDCLIVSVKEKEIIIKEWIK